MTKGVITTKSFEDNYEDGNAASVWNLFIGDIEDRHISYKDALLKILRSRGAKRVLDVACGTGPDSVMLVEEGFQVTSIDASDKMLKYALRTRWDRRKEPNFDQWIILEANWLTLYKDLEDVVGEGYDAIICLGNSFSHMLDPEGDQRDQRKALSNFKQCLKKGGLLIIDHRNFDEFQEGGLAPAKSIYYHIQGKTDIKSSLVIRDGKPQYIHYDYTIEPLKDKSTTKYSQIPDRINFYFRLFPHQLKVFSPMIEQIFDPESKHTIYGDYKPLGEIESPGYYIHTIDRV